MLLRKLFYINMVELLNVQWNDGTNFFIILNTFYILSFLYLQFSHYYHFFVTYVFVIFGKMKLS